MTGKKVITKGEFDKPQPLYTWTQIVYALHALSPAIAILGAAPGVATFLICSGDIAAPDVVHDDRNDRRHAVRREQGEKPFVAAVVQENPIILSGRVVGKHPVVLKPAVDRSSYGRR